jgi:hypothetical protein
LKVVYHCYGGAHASPTAAAIHLGLLSKQKLPSPADFRKLPYFDCITGSRHGKLIKVGTDHLGNDVYILARRNSPQLVINLIQEFVKLNGGDPSQYLFVNCVQLFNPLMVTGGFSSRAMGWVNFGRPVVTFGTILSFPILVSIVTRTQNHLEKSKQK